MELILASSSPYRADVLRKLGLPFTQQAPEVDETPRLSESPRALAARLAHAKSHQVFVENPTAVVIGSDQVVVHAGQTAGKPGSRAAAIEQLRQQSGHEVLFLTALCVLSPGRMQHAVEEYRARFLNLDDRLIEDYVDFEKPLDCAGAFKCEGAGIALLEYMRGDDPNTLIGLPLLRLTTFLTELGVPLFRR